MTIYLPANWGGWEIELLQTNLKNFKGLLYNMSLACPRAIHTSYNFVFSSHILSGFRGLFQICRVLLFNKPSAGKTNILASSSTFSLGTLKL